MCKPLADQKEAILDKMAPTDRDCAIGFTCVEMLAGIVRELFFVRISIVRKSISGKEKDRKYYQAAMQMHNPPLPQRAVALELTIHEKSGKSVNCSPLDRASLMLSKSV